jgi:hypothetical protein
VAGIRSLETIQEISSMVCRPAGRNGPPAPLRMVPFRTLPEVTIKMVYLYDIFNVSNLEVTVTSNDILRVEIERSSPAVSVDFTYYCSVVNDH